MDCIDWGGGGPTPYQLEIAEMIQESDRVAVRAPRHAGKSAIAADLILHWALVWDGRADWKIPTRASVGSQLTKYLWPEIHKQARQLRWDVIGREPFDTRNELMLTTLRLETGSAFMVTSTKEAKEEGAQAEKLLLIFDESKEIVDDAWGAWEGSFLGGTGKWLAISTPGNARGVFYDSHRKAPEDPEWATRKITAQEGIDALLTSFEGKF